MAKKEAATQSTGWFAKFGAFATVVSSIISLLFVLFFVALIIPAIVSHVATVNANVAVIAIDGMIVSDGGSSFLSSSTTSTDTVALIKQAQDDPAIKAIIFDINSPGGTPVATEEIANAIKKTNKTTVAVIRESGTSGAYWVASATQHIFASPLSITGSIGVLASYVDFSGFMADHNITYNRLVAGQYKDVGSPYTPLTSEERALFEHVLTETHDQFIDAVAANRKMPRKDVADLANGFVYLGTDAQQLGLVDELGGMDDATAYVEKRIGETAKIAEYSKPPSFLEALTKATSGWTYSLGEGIGSAIMNQRVQSTPHLSLS